MLFKTRKKAGGFYFSKEYPTRFVRINKLAFWLLGIWRWIRVQCPVTRLLGYQYTPAQDLIEIDLTYLCNLRCFNCNRSSAQAPEAHHINKSQISDFVEQSINEGRQWQRVRVLGGEPTLHPDFLEIITILKKLKRTNQDTRIEVVTNGYGKQVNTMLKELPPDIWIENSAKSDNIQPGFGPFNLAPIDDKRYKFADYKNGCDIATSCGVGLTPQGYYPCAVAGGIDRVQGLKRGRTSLPAPNDDMRDLMEETCRLCGRFRDGHYIPTKLRKPLEEQKTSKSWDIIYTDWERRKLTR